MSGFPFVYRGTAHHWDENGLADITQRPGEIEQDSPGDDRVDGAWLEYFKKSDN